MPSGCLVTRHLLPYVQEKLLRIREQRSWQRKINFKSEIALQVFEVFSRFLALDVFVVFSLIFPLLSSGDDVLVSTAVVDDLPLLSRVFTVNSHLDIITNRQS